ncbi:TonB-dependent receptor [Rugamonas sp.]|uniref:TonB-dependent receptor n=1 Tax=Rugamonas sp. TaxID=1926287 RepID=UPI0025D5E76E|nr:TonB-dependent receptor [Rugamonas sp.]
MKRTRLHLAIATLFTATTALSASAWAQQAADAMPTTTPAASDDAAPAGAKRAPRSDQIQLVVVTAQKRKEDVNKVPISVSVVQGEDLAAKHITGLEDITRNVPNISFSGGTQGSGAGLSNIEMRGISSSAGSGTVGIYMDDVSMTTRNLYSLGSPEPKFFDVDRIEVLRGPQGTLYGASSMGGTLKVIMNQPDLKHVTNSFSTEVSATDKAGGLNDTVNAVLNVPLIPNEMALRIGVQSSHIGGYIKQVDPDTLATVHDHTNTENDVVVRAALKWNVTRDLTVTPSIFYQQVKTGDLGTEYPLSQTTGAALQPYQISKPVLEPGKDKLFTPSLTVNYDLGAADLISVSSYYQRTFDRTQDGTQANSSFIGGVFVTPSAPDGLAGALSVLPGYVYLNNQVHQFSQELRVSSKGYDPKGGTPLTWIGGLYFSNLHTTVNDYEPIPGIGALFKSYGVSPDDPNIVTGSFPGAFAGDSAYFSARHYRTQQEAVFGELSYHMTPDLTFTAGAREVHATDSLAREGSNYFTSTPGETIQQPHDVDSRAFTPKFAVSWNVDASNMLYANAAKGFRLGSQNRDIPLSLCGAELNSMGLTQAPASFGADSLWSYELGNKSRFLNNRLSVNAAVYYIDWKNIQVDRTLDCTFDYETNAGKARSAGLELEVKAKPTADLTIDFSTGYSNAYLVEANQALGSNGGQKVPGVPKFNATLGGEYRFTITGDTDGFVRMTGHWTGSSYGTTHDTDTDYTRPAYATVDASIGANVGKYQVSLFAKNLGNNDKIIQKPSVQFFQENYRLVPRTVGLNFSGSI